MLRPRKKWLPAALLLVSIGCRETMKPLQYLGKAELAYYKDKTTEISYPHVHSDTPQQVAFSDAPRTVDSAAERPSDLLDAEQDIWELTLVEALHTALANNAIIRSAQSSALATGDRTPSVYDQAIQETGILFSNRGVEGALSAFDAQFTTSMIWGRNESAQNIAFFGPEGQDPVLSRDTGNFEARLQKQFATGGTMAVTHNWDYLYSNARAQLFPSSYAGAISASYRQPLWAGSGVEYTRIAGPLNPQFTAITGVSQGVVIARINNDITLADFQAAVRDLLRDVETAYWDLFLAYRTFHAAVAARESSKESWRQEIVKKEAGAGVSQDEPQARDQYFETRALAEFSLNRIYEAESELRRLMGVAVHDGRVIRPATDPVMAEFKPDWYMALTEALTQRVELRRQKWNIKSLELQLQAAESLTNPRLDFISEYRVNGFGDQLFGENDDDGVTSQGFRSAYETITQGNQTGWALGFEMSIPIGFRSALAQKRNLELRLAKAREVLAVQEMDIAHQLRNAYQEIALHYANAQSNFNRYTAARDRVNIIREQVRVGVEGATRDLQLRAIRAQAAAETEYYTSLVRYNQAIMRFEYFKGTLLEFNNVQLEEGGWTPQAYEQALRRAWARSHALDARKFLDSEPPVFETQGFVGELMLDPYKTLRDENSELTGDPASLSPTPLLDEGVPPSPAPAADDNSASEATSEDAGSDPGRNSKTGSDADTPNAPESDTDKDDAETKSPEVKDVRNRFPAPGDAETSALGPQPIPVAETDSAPIPILPLPYDVQETPEPIVRQVEAEVEDAAPSGLKQSVYEVPSADRAEREAGAIEQSVFERAEPAPVSVDEGTDASAAAIEAAAPAVPTPARRPAGISVWAEPGVTANPAEPDHDAAAQPERPSAFRSSGRWTSPQRPRALKAFVPTRPKQLRPVSDAQSPSAQTSSLTPLKSDLEPKPVSQPTSEESGTSAVAEPAPFRWDRMPPELLD